MRPGSSGRDSAGRDPTVRPTRPGLRVLGPACRVPSPVADEGLVHRWTQTVDHPVTGRTGWTMDAPQPDDSDTTEPPDPDSLLAPNPGDGFVCPVPCERCDALGPGGCEDCLDCLLWPEVLPPHEATPARAPVGPTAPTRTADLRTRRAALDIGARVGLVSRRFRRDRQLSQRALAAALGWTQASINRAERDAAPLTVRRVESFLGHLGFRLAIVPGDTEAASALGEHPDEAWGAPDLVAHDAAGRRPPPYGQVTWNSIIDRRLYSRILGHEAEWTWQQPRA